MYHKVQHKQDRGNISHSTSRETEEQYQIKATTLKQFPPQLFPPYPAQIYPDCTTDSTTRWSPLSSPNRCLQSVHRECEPTTNQTTTGPINTWYPDTHPLWHGHNPFQGGEPRDHGWKLGENQPTTRGNRALIEQYTGTSDLEGGRQVGSETGQRAGEEERERERGWRDRSGRELPCAVVDDDGRARGGVHGWQLRRVPAGSCLRRRRSDREAGHRGPPRWRPRSLPPGGRLIEPRWAGVGRRRAGLGSGRSISGDRMARGLERFEEAGGARRVAWRGDGDETSRVGLVWLTREAGRKAGEVVEESGWLVELWLVIVRACVPALVGGWPLGSVRVCEVR